jgi:hypothetical protein
MQPPREEYLGDGVYIGFDGYQYVLKANSHINPTDTIALDPHVVKALLKYIKDTEEYLQGGKDASEKED